MNGGQIAFYASVATVIPVVFSIYVVGLRGATQTSWRRLGAFRMAQYERAVRNVYRRSFSDEADTALKRWAMAATYLVTLLAVSAATMILLGLLLFSLVGPFLGETFALHALSSNRATSGAATWSTIGLATAGAAVVVPFLPVFGSIAAQLLGRKPRDEG